MQWQKGYGEITAEDLVYTWNYHLKSKSFQVGTALFPIDGVKADGSHVVEVKTKQPFGAFPGVTMGYGGLMVCAKAHKEMGNDAYSATPVGSGPFQIESKRGSEIVLVRNPTYWRPGLPKLDRVTYRAIPDSTTRLQALAKNELDFVTHPDPRELAGNSQEPELRGQVDARAGNGTTPSSTSSTATFRTPTSWCARRSPMPSIARRSSGRSTTAKASRPTTRSPPATWAIAGRSCAIPRTATSRRRRS